MIFFFIATGLAFLAWDFLSKAPPNSFSVLNSS